MRNLTSALSLCVFASFTPSLAAQDATETRTTTQSRPAMMLRTTDTGLTFFLTAQFMGSGNSPDLRPGQAASFTMDRSGEFSMELVEASDYLWLDVDPAGVMEAFPEQIDEAREQLNAAAGLIAAMNGGNAKQIGESLAPLIDLPKQCARFQIRIPDDPTTFIGNPDAEGDVRVLIDAVPVVDSDFARMHEALNPTEAPVPVLSARDSLMSMTMNVDMDAMQPMFMDLVTMMMSFAGNMGSEEQMTTAKDAMNQWFGAFNGIGGMVWSAEGGMRGAFGVKDSEAANAFLTSEEYREFFESSFEQVGGDGSMTDEFEHEGVQVIRFESEVPLPPGAADQMPIPMFNEDGLMVQRVAIAGPYMLMSMFDADDSGDGMRGLISATKAEEIRTRRSQDLMRMDFSLKRLADLSGQPIPTGAVPDELSVLLRKTDRAMRLELRLR